MIEVKVLASGSKGNCIMVKSAEKRILIDCGISVRSLGKALSQAGSSYGAISAILVTHEHNDHVASVAQVSEAYGIPVFANAITMSAVKRRTGLKGGYYFEEVTPFTLAGMEIRPFRVSHDAVYPVGYSIADGDSRFTYATDLGYFSPSVKEAIKGSDLLLIESNHDVHMLLHGPYPQRLKERILSQRGHLSNRNCAEVIRESLESGTKKFILGHLSEQNNTEDLALTTNVTLLEEWGAHKDKDYELYVANQKGLEPTVTTK